MDRLTDWQVQKDCRLAGQNLAVSESEGTNRLSERQVQQDCSMAGQNLAVSESEGMSRLAGTEGPLLSRAEPGCVGLRGNEQTGRHRRTAS